MGPKIIKNINLVYQNDSFSYKDYPDISRIRVLTYDNEEGERKTQVDVATMNNRGLPNWGPCPTKELEEALITVAMLALADRISRSL